MRDLSNVFLLTDLDGTLLPNDKILSKRDREAIKRFRADGGNFSVATGRTIQSAMRYFDELEIDLPVILYNGSLIYDTIAEKVLFTDVLPDCAVDIGREMLDFMENPGAEVLRLDNIYIVCNNEYEEEHTKICQVEPIFTTFDEVPRGDWFKILFASEPALLTKLEKFAADKNYPVDFVRSHEIFYEMLPKGSSKGTALKEYVRIMGMENHMIYAAGDFDNDIEMLKTADVGATPANAQQSVKDIADVVLENTSDEGFIAELIDLIYEKNETA